MTTNKSVGWDIGKLRLPVPPLPALDSARTLDPASDILFDLFAAAINDELADHWATMTVGTPLATHDPVHSKFREVPDEDAMRQVKSDWPLLCVYVDETPQTIQQSTLDEEFLVTRWGVDWILGTLEAADMVRLGGALRAVLKTCVAVIKEGGHKAYASYVSNGYTLVRPVFADCGFDSVRLVEGRCGGAKFSERSPKYHAMSMTLETTELIKIGDRGGTFTGATIKVGTGDASGIAADLVIGDTSIPVQQG